MTYLDNAATTRVSQACAQAVYETLCGCFANPSSLYGIGLAAQKRLEAARAEVAAGMGAAPEEVYFTGSGTEANNLAVLGGARARRSWGRAVVLTGFEHPSVEQCAKALAAEGFAVRRIMPDGQGRVDEEALVAAVDRDTALVAVMQVNNEIGTVLDVERIAGRVKAANRRTAVHCDNVQGFLKHPALRLGEGIDTMAVSAHKIHGPKGIGALYVRRGHNLENVLHGGLQERALRPGTENLAYAVGFAKAVELARPHCAGQFERLRRLNAMLREAAAALPGVRINSPQDGSPYIFNLSLIGYRSETLLHFLEQKEIYVSSGSACSKGEKSHTLSAMALPRGVIDGALRVSFSDETTEQEVQALAEALAEAQKILLHT